MPAGTPTRCRGIAWRERPHPKDYAPSVAPITRLQPDLTAQVRRRSEKPPFYCELHVYFTRSRRSGQGQKGRESALCHRASTQSARAVGRPPTNLRENCSGASLFLPLPLFPRFSRTFVPSKRITSLLRRPGQRRPPRQRFSSRGSPSTPHRVPARCGRWPISIVPQYTFPGGRRRSNAGRCPCSTSR